MCAADYARQYQEAWEELKILAPLKGTKGIKYLFADFTNLHNTSYYLDDMTLYNPDVHQDKGDKIAHCKIQTVRLPMPNLIKGLTSGPESLHKVFITALANARKKPTIPAWVPQSVRNDILQELGRFKPGIVELLDQLHELAILTTTEKRGEVKKTRTQERF